jgi:hypothetical protein
MLNPPYVGTAEGVARGWGRDTRADLVARAIHLARRPGWRIAFCEYDDPDLDRRFAPAGWRKARWKASGRDGHRERVWLSPGFGA